ncbi:MAG: hypothetical protein KDD61_06135 [Bdellovibrionales bacterium]|nr:hypothetical protein [Bdellovibrionales bacterium]
MKYIFALVTFFGASSSYATNYFCEAYCGYKSYGALGLVEYTDNKGQWVNSDGNTRSSAFNNLKSQCRSIDSDYALYTDRSYSAWAKASNSCRKE